MNNHPRENALKVIEHYGKGLLSDREVISELLFAVDQLVDELTLAYNRHLLDNLSKNATIGSQSRAMLRINDYAKDAIIALEIGSTDYVKQCLQDFVSLTEPLDK